jgi:hypothetical protein
VYYLQQVETKYNTDVAENDEEQDNNLKPEQFAMLEVVNTSCLVLGYSLVKA